MRPATLIIDIDGCIFRHKGDGASEQWYGQHELLPGVLEFLDAREREGCFIVLCTARKESNRERLVAVLDRHGIYYDHLIMGVTSGERVLINDMKPHGRPSARAIEMERNGCLKESYSQQAPALG